MNVILTGGGSGGHIYPVLAVGDKIREMDPDSKLLFIGNDIGLEKDVVPATGCEFRLVEAVPFERGLSGLYKMFTGIRRGRNESLRIMREFHPDAVIGTGGFTTVPVILAGRKYGAACYIDDGNVFPGKANLFLERYADRVFLGFEEASKYFRHPEKQIVVGNPVRSAFYGADREESRRVIGASKDEFVVFGFAGSQGATFVNKTLYGLMRHYSGQPGIRIIFSIGSLHEKLFREQMEKDGTVFADNIVVRPYIHDMEHYLKGADLVISRAGAISIAEACVCGAPMILVPSPYVPGDHQRKNARAIEARGGAIVIEEQDFSVERAGEEIERLRKNPDVLKEMGERAQSCAPFDAAGRMSEIILKDYERRKKAGRRKSGAK